MKPATAIDALLLKRHPLPWPDGGSKENRGRVAIIGGSRDLSGAVLLACVAALRAGAGKLQMATVESRAGYFATALPEALVTGLRETETGAMCRSNGALLTSKVKGSDTILIGPGMLETEDTRILVKQLAADMEDTAFVFDAGALDGIAASHFLNGKHLPVLTPHAGEMANLLGIDRETVESKPAEIAETVARDLNAVVILKGAETFIADPGGNMWFYRGGGVGLGTSGSGDVLAGVVAGLLARGATPVEASCWAVYLHGEAGAGLAKTIGPLGFLAREIADEIPRLMGQFPRS
ncbi:NAD(P)H-hydrate dehydratase [Oryzicola mucosus]|uniref:ADP-dependent (S)-NAD(P)H-hydrate dehydratase n=1 Tax=Oryzicola mucosus TaxID=2767425 RepID=A0A8J6U9B8_9HYPH|nr:NAD(P)H-hydrate dehydratase [Oryzicola mucosus]MBD0416967.1 NAD(P)H-hydrate dehydratase [Oryzicola mucosus]